MPKRDLVQERSDEAAEPATKRARVDVPEARGEKKRAAEDHEVLDLKRARYGSLSLLGVSEETCDGLLKAFSMRGISWRQLVRDVVYRRKEGADLEVFQKLIHHRGALDGECYRDAVLELFPTDFFAVRLEPRLKVEEKDGCIRLVRTWYVFKIYNGPDKGPASPLVGEHCEVVVKAPGSTALTSDVDTTISTTGLQCINTQHIVGLPVTTCDPATYIKAKIVESFYAASQKKYGVTSSKNRDSNVYSDGFLEPGIYPEFRHPKFAAVRLQKDKKRDFQEKEFYAENKYEKHLCELSASLVPIRLYHDALKGASEEVWKKWCQALLRKVEVLFKGDSDEDRVKQSLKAVIQYVDDLVGLRTEKLKQKVKELELRLGASKVFSDLEVTALNELYVDALLKLGCELKELHAVEDELKTLDGEIHTRGEDLKNKQIVHKIIYEAHEARLRLKESQTGKQYGVAEENKTSEEAIKATAMELQKKEEEVGTLQTDLDNLLSSFADKLREIAKRKCQCQKLQIEANLFANEAYINWAAPYHVVEGGQAGEKVKLTIQAMFCSAIHQIGFRLLHAQELEREDHTPSEVAYQVAKYGHRVAELIFESVPTQGYDEAALRSCFSGTPKKGAPFLLGRFFSKIDGQPPAANLFLNVEALLLLNRDVQLLRGYKKNNALRDDCERFSEAAKFLARVETSAGRDTRQPENTVLLELACSLIVLGYYTKFRKKPSKSVGEGHQSLPWGIGSMVSVFAKYKVSNTVVDEEEVMVPPGRFLPRVTSWDRSLDGAAASILHPVPSPEEWDPPAPTVERFIGRQREIDTIEDTLEKREHRCVVLCGFGGLGKTQIALEFVRRCVQKSPDYYEKVFWIKSQGDLRAQFTCIGQKYGVLFGGDASVDWSGDRARRGVSDICEVLFNLYRRVLFVFDGADTHTLSTIENFMPPWRYAGKVKVLITSCEQSWSASFNPLQIDGFDPGDAKDYVKAHIANVADEDAESLASGLSYYPLALSQAVSYINRTSKSVESYLEFFQTMKFRVDALRHEGAHLGYGKTVLSIYLISLVGIFRAHVHNQEIKRLALEVLNVCAFLHTEKIPRSLLLNDLMGADESQIDAVVELCLSLSLFRKTNGVVPELGMHGITQNAIQLFLPTFDELDVYGVVFGSTTSASTKDQQHFADKCVDLIKAHTAKEPGGLDSERERRQKGWIERIASHIETVTLPTSVEPCDILNETELYKRMLVLYEHIRKLLSHAKGAGLNSIHVNRLVVKFGIYTGGALGRISEEIQYIEEALEQQKGCEQYRDESERVRDIVVTRHELAYAYGLAGKITEQLACLEDVCQLKREYLSDSNDGRKSIAITLRELGRAYYSAGDLQGGEKLIQEALDMQKEIYGDQEWPKKHRVATTLHYLGNVYLAKRDLVKARENYEQSRVIKEHKYSKEEPVPILADTFHGLGDVSTKEGIECKKRGDLRKMADYSEEALKHYNTSLEMNRALFGGVDERTQRDFPHPSKIATLLGIGRVYGKLKEDYNVWEQYIKKAHVMAEDLYGKDARHPNLARIYENYADHAYVVATNSQLEGETLLTALEKAERCYERAKCLYADLPGYVEDHYVRKHLEDKASICSEELRAAKAGSFTIIQRSTI